VKAQLWVGRKLSLSIIVSLVFIVATFQCVEAYELTWTGCGITKGAFMNEIANAYRKKTGNTIKISGGGATKGLRAVAANTSDLGGTCRDWLGGVADKDPREADAQLIQVAWDALVVIVHPKNPVNDITVEQLKDVYDGKLTSWNNLGGADKKIALVTRDGKHSGVGHMFRLLVFKNQQHDFMARSYIVKSTGPLEKKIARTPISMGIDGISSARKIKVKILSLNGISPTKVNIASGRYPLFRPLYVVVNKNANQKAKEVVDFILSSEGQAIISQQGTVNLGEGRALEPLWLEKAKHFNK